MNQNCVFQITSFAKQIDQKHTKNIKKFRLRRAEWVRELGEPKAPLENNPIRELGEPAS